MKNFAITLFGFLILTASYKAQIEQVIVETYYVSDSDDATDTLANPFEGIILNEGSTTYRIFVDLAEGSKINKIYGSEERNLEIISTDVFFNHRDRGASFGYEVNDNKLDENTLALDTWITLGFASDAHMGIPKDLDTDGSIIGGVNNDGGSGMISEGLLNNDSPEAGIALTTADGLLSTDSVPNAFSSFAIDDAFVDSTIFQLEISNQFLSNEASLSAANGMIGPTEENIVLVAQVTTAGELTSFKLNFEVELINDFGDTEIVNFVATDSLLSPGETYSPWLCYPFVGGCTDPDYIEYDAAAVLDDGSCQTLAVIGCTDSQACNFNSEANFNVQELCCYENMPDDCYTDINLICTISGLADVKEKIDFNIYPNPVKSDLNLSFNTFNFPNATDIQAHIIDASGRILNTINIETFGGEDLIERMPLQGLSNGHYFLYLSSTEFVYSAPFIKAE